METTFSGSLWGTKTSTVSDHESFFGRKTYAKMLLEPIMQIDYLALNI